jgi:hypothetical protein
MKTIISIVALALGFASSGHAAVVDLGSFAGHRYFYDTGVFTSLDGARLGAQAAGGQLASITSAAENNFLILQISPLGAGNLRTAWIGLSRPTPADPSGIAEKRSPMTTGDQQEESSLIQNRLARPPRCSTSMTRLLPSDIGLTHITPARNLLMRSMKSCQNPLQCHFSGLLRLAG